MPITMAPDAPMTVERAKREIEKVLAQLEGTGVVVTDIGMLEHVVDASTCAPSPRRREIYIDLLQLLPRYTPFRP